MSVVQLLTLTGAHSVIDKFAAPSAVEDTAVNQAEAGMFAADSGITVAEAADMFVAEAAHNHIASAVVA
ncbi:MAG: hypothetical protein V1897_10135 [Pseudomonadota bacterium]